jgi:serine/threonine-protein kinase HipA
VAGANCDDHTKNFSFLLPEGGQWRLSPAYDVTHAHSPSNKWTRQHLMAVNGENRNIMKSDVLEVGDRFAVPGVAAILNDVLDSVSRWADFARQADVPRDTINEIGDDIKVWSSNLR